MILNGTPLLGRPLESGSPLSATFQRRKLSIDALHSQVILETQEIEEEGLYHARCRQSGNATTQETTPELDGFLSVFSNRGVLEGPERPKSRTSHTSTVPLRLPA
jgi:hypothetical protein